MGWKTAPLALCLLLAGCAGGPFSRPPGTILQQRLRATVHDPYLEAEAGPETDGTRPRDYLSPLPEPVRNRIFADSLFAR